MKIIKQTYKNGYPYVIAKTDKGFLHFTTKGTMADCKKALKNFSDKN